VTGQGPVFGPQVRVTPDVRSFPDLGKLSFPGVFYFMKYRKSVNKGSSAHKFRKHTSHTKSINMRGAPMRGGIRL